MAGTVVLWADDRPGGLQYGENVDVRTHFRSRAGIVDLIIAAAITSITVIGALTVANDEGDTVRYPSGWWFVLLVLPGIGVAFRRLFPLCVLGVVVFSTMAIWASGLPDSALAATVAIYSAVLYGPPRSGTWAGFGGALGLTLFTLLGSLTDNVPYFYVALVALCCMTALALGSHSASRLQYINEVERSAAEAEVLREAAANARVAEERNRIARELHDVVAHGLSVIVVQSAAAQRVFDNDPEGARAAISEVETTARASLDDMRHVLGALRASDDETLRPTPSIDSLGELVEQFEAAELDVELVVDPDVDTANGALETTAYRIVQESLTNVLKHAGPRTSASVTLSQSEQELAIVVCDNGRGAAADAADPGFGLLGMQERIDLFGGTLRAGARPGGGFEVRALLPLKAGLS